MKIKIDANKITQTIKNLQSEIVKDIQEGVKNLATVTHAKIVEMAHSELRSSQKQYLDSLSIKFESENVHIITLNKNANWIEEGIEPNTDMKPSLLKNGKVSKSGNTYKVIPFSHSKSSSENTPSSQSLIGQVKSALSAKKIPFNQIEKDRSGKPKLGKLHTLNIPSKIPGKGNTPALQGVNIYQTKAKGGKVRRDIVTFRTVSSGSASAGKWIHPGSEGKEFFSKAVQFANTTWEQQILPEILKKYK